MIFVCGDTHGTYDIKKLNSKTWPEGRDLSRKDFLIILGDSGINWNHHPENREDLYLKKWLESKGWTTIDVLGNHHNYDRLENEEVVDFYGGKAYKISDSIFALKRGAVVEIDGVKIFSMGGGFSIDKSRRIDHMSWWPQEIPSFKEMKEAKENLLKHDNKVDLILSHTCSNRVFRLIDKEFGMSYKSGDEEKSIRDFFDWVEDDIEYKQWHFGHFHVDYKVDEKHWCHYNKKPFLIESLQ